MTHEEPMVRSYASFEEALEDMRKATDKANAQLHDKQRAVTWGDYWIRFYDPAEGIAIFGKIMTLEESREGEFKGIDQIEDPREREATLAGAEETMRTLIASHQDGYMFGNCWSILEPRGELGSTHRANLWPISQAVFEAARAGDWQIRDMDPALIAEILMAYDEYRDWYLSRDWS